MPNRINKPLSTFKVQVDAFIRNVVSKTIRKAIDIILSPCCELSATSASFTCTDTDIATLVLTINTAIVFPTHVSAFLIVDDVIVQSNGTYDNNGKLTFTGVDVSAGGDAEFGALILLPTNSNSSTGVFLTVAGITETLPTCS